jgi:hypothetical protein
MARNSVALDLHMVTFDFFFFFKMSHKTRVRGVNREKFSALVSHVFIVLCNEIANCLREVVKSP